VTPLTQQPVRIGLLGCGLIAQYAHLPALKKAEGVELAAVCDLASDLAACVASQYGASRWFTEVERFLSEGDLDAVLIATADQQHVPNALACIRAGKHVLIEKPLGTNLEECRRLASAAEEAGCKVQVGNMKRYDPGIQFAQKFICSRMGQRLSVSGWYSDTTVRPRMQASLRLPLLRSESQQGLDEAFKKNKRVYKLFTHGSHLVDTLRFIGGELTAVDARLAVKYENYSWHGVLEFADGAVGHFELTTAVKMDWLEGFRVHGENGSVEINSFLPFSNRASEVRVFDAAEGEYRSPILPDSDPYERQLEAFARAIRDDEPVTPNAHDGMADLAVLHAILRSVEECRPIEISARSGV
jgi:predicted dehydrogenase